MSCIQLSQKIKKKISRLEGESFHVRAVTEPVAVATFEVGQGREDAARRHAKALCQGPDHQVWSKALKTCLKTRSQVA